MKTEILEGNKMIAEFVGCEITGDLVKRMTKYYSFPKTFSRTVHIEDLEYHSSWDWIMDVWHKYRDIKFMEETPQKLHLNYCARLAQHLAYGTIEEFFKTMTIAIQWYNQNSAR